MSKITDPLEKGWLKTVLNDVHKESQRVPELEAEVQRLRDALNDFARQNCEVGLQQMREKHSNLLAASR